MTFDGVLCKAFIFRHQLQDWIAMLAEHVDIVNQDP
jgi:hypothetical protein